MKTADRIVLIVPAYNEDERIGAVLAVAKSVPLIDGIVVVNDGSTDSTAQVAEAWGVRVVNLAINQGKGSAMQTGINAVDADILVFSDADIMGLKPRHFTQLIQPLVEDKSLMMTVGKFSGGRLRTDLSQKLLPAISGQRAVRRHLLEGLPDLSTSRFGVEILLSRHAKLSGAKVLEVTLNDLTHVTKEEKLGTLRGLSARLRMYQEMAKSIRPTKKLDDPPWPRE
jgi:polyisoprenyl-phosphate glycosyltransferase